MKMVIASWHYIIDIFIAMQSYVGKHLTPRGGSDFEGVGGI